MRALGRLSFLKLPAGSAIQRAGCILAILVCLSCGFTPETVMAQQSGISASQAAAIAKSQHGGQVLKVSRSGNSYRVKLLLPSGTVKTVTVSAGRR